MTKRERKPRAPTAGAVGWKYLLLADLHVSERTLWRALEVLRASGEHASAHGAHIVMLGDFWDLRNVIHVRHAHAVLEQIAAWQAKGVECTFIPGNHDQVTIDGSIHGLRIFDQLPQMTVVTQPKLDEIRQTAFLPWRENPGDQQTLFEGVPEGYTVFGHAEVQGALANNNKPAAGKVTLSTMNRFRAVYLGHYHARQQLGSHTWYVGSPFEMDFGERESPHGVALVSSDDVAPAFIEFEAMPKHHVLTPPFKGDELARVREHDFVEVRATREQLDHPSFAPMLADVPGHVRTSVITPKTKEGAPRFALTLADALVAYLDQEHDAAELHGSTLGVPREELLALGRDYLARVPDARVIVPAGKHVRVLSASIENFLAIQGPVLLNIEGRGSVLVRGRMGVGKTSLVDAITWCLFGATSPRKMGATGASLRADDIVHDDASEARVQVRLMIDETPATITRSKKRGKGAEIVIDYAGAPPAGISDQQLLVQHLVGLNYDLWRSCVYLGQGAVSNFLTDADKRRKELLSSAFSLGACGDALKLVRATLKDVANKTARSTTEVEANKRALAVLAETDYTEQIKLFEEQREATKSAAREKGEAATKAIADCDASLAQEESWKTVRTEQDGRLTALMKSFGASFGTEASAAEQQRVGSARAELGLLQRDRGRLAAEAERLAAGRSGSIVMCPTCQRPLDESGIETQLEQLRLKIGQHDEAIRTTEATLSALLTRHEESEAVIAERRSAIEADIADARTTLARCDAALATFARIRDNRAANENTLVEARTIWQKAEAALNPFRARQEEHEARITSLRATIERDEADLRALLHQCSGLEFWEAGFSQQGIPVLVLRAAVFDLEEHANRFLGVLTDTALSTQLSIEGDDLVIKFRKRGSDGVVRERDYLQLSGGERRCAELAFAPFALSEMIFARMGVRVSLLVIDELTTHLGAEEKPRVCDALRVLDRETVLVIDHDTSVQGSFDHSIVCEQDGGRFTLSEGT